MNESRNTSIEDPVAEPHFTGANVPVTVAARIMGKAPMFIRIGLQRGLLPFGIAFKSDDKCQTYNYYISPKLFYEYTGYVVTEADFQEEELLEHNDKVIDHHMEIG